MENLQICKKTEFFLVGQYFYCIKVQKNCQKKKHRKAPKFYGNCAQKFFCPKLKNQLLKWRNFALFCHTGGRLFYNDEGKRINWKRVYEWLEEGLI